MLIWSDIIAHKAPRFQKFYACVFPIVHGAVQMIYCLDPSDGCLDPSDGIM